MRGAITMGVPATAEDWARCLRTAACCGGEVVVPFEAEALLRLARLLEAGARAEAVLERAAMVARQAEASLARAEAAWRRQRAAQAGALALAFGAAALLAAGRGLGWW
jgi:hypothetical protein